MDTFVDGKLVDGTLANGKQAPNRERDGTARKSKANAALPIGQSVIARHEFDVKVGRWPVFREALKQIVDSDSTRVRRPILRICIRLMPVTRRAAGLAALLGKHETVYERTPRAIVDLEYASIADYLSARSSPDGRLIWDMNFGPNTAPSATLVSVNLIEPC